MVGNLTRNVTEDNLREIFSNYGTLKAVELVMDRAVNLPKGYAHVEFESPEDAEKAIDYMNNGQIDGQAIRCAHVRASDRHWRSSGICGGLRQPCKAVCSMPHTVHRVPCSAG